MSYCKPEWRNPPVNKEKRKIKAISSKDKSALHVITSEVILPAVKKKRLDLPCNTQRPLLSLQDAQWLPLATLERGSAQGRARTPSGKYR